MGAAVLAALGLLAIGCRATPGRVEPAAAPATGEVVLPPDYDPARTYPVVEILPATGSTAATLLQMFLVRVGLGRLADEPPDAQVAALRPYLFRAAGRARRGVIFVFARGRGSFDDYRTPEAWAGTIARYERQVLADLRAVAQAHRVDANRLILAGFSMGGDLSWAIALRHPEVVHGAIVMASRATYRPDPAGASAVMSAGTRFFLTMGDADERIRQRLASAAARTLDRWGVPHQFETLHGAGHEPAPPDVFGRALDFVLAP
jgi:predicted esterase